MTETTSATIDKQAPPSEEVTCRVDALLSKIASAKNPKEVKAILKGDLAAGAMIGNQLGDYQTDFHNRVVDIYEAGIITKKIAESLLLLTGAHEYSDDYKTRLGQYEQVAYLRHELRDSYDATVPLAERSAVFSALIEAKQPNGRKNFVPEYGTFVERASVVVALGSVSSRSLVLDDESAMSTAANDATARALILAEGSRMLSFYFRGNSTD